MTHDELLAKIDEKRDYAVERFGLDDGFNALRAVVELHKPYETPDYDVITCDHCGQLNSAEDVPYPCPTIQAIEKELG